MYSLSARGGGETSGSLTDVYLVAEGGSDVLTWAHFIFVTPAGRIAAALNNLSDCPAPGRGVKGKSLVVETSLSTDLDSAIQL